MYQQDAEEDTRIYDVVMNHEEQYSIWAEGRPIPAGWRAVGKRGQKPECLAYIDEVWTDMRPLSLRLHMEANAKAQAEATAESGGASIPASAEGVPGVIPPELAIATDAN